MIKEDTAYNIAKLIATDISDRSGLGDMWSSIDDETRAEIISEWRELIIKQFDLKDALVKDNVKPKCICPEHAHDEACEVCIAGSGKQETPITEKAAYEIDIDIDGNVEEVVPAKLSRQLEVQARTGFYEGIEWFACWLLDHAEGETITEEQLRPWAISAWQEYLAKKE